MFKKDDDCRKDCFSWCHNGCILIGPTGPTGPLFYSSLYILNSKVPYNL